MSALRQVQPRVPLKARPKRNVNREELLEEICQRYTKTLEYLGR